MGVIKQTFLQQQQQSYARRQERVCPCQESKKQGEAPQKWRKHLSAADRLTSLSSGSV